MALWLLLVLSLGESTSFAQQKEEPRKPAPEHEEEGARYSPPGAWKSVEIGDFYFKRKDYRGALSRYQEAVTTNRDYAPGYLGLGKVYEKLHQPQKALEAYQKYLDLLPSARDAEEAKSVHRAIAKLQRVLKKSSGNSPGRAPSSALKSPPL